eukprot:TRINITY_DN2592_c0_g1_i1.p1 TRINITY_DN2592_c0_g1~~TRINITY_DN2592_c0_g1_i1.p1  ORF type:complete len:335 (+),score=38.33 TRINITY_DN2592_c0_g1_i1:58-1062(+)
MVRLTVIKIWQAHGGLIDDMILVNDTFWSCGNQSIIVWDKMTYKKLQQLSAHTAKVACLKSTASDNKIFIWSGSFDTDVLIWDSSSYTCVQALSGYHMDTVRCIFEVHSSKLIGTASKDLVLYFWKFNQGTHQASRAYSRSRIRIKQLGSTSRLTAPPRSGQWDITEENSKKVPRIREGRSVSVAVSFLRWRAPAGAARSKVVMSSHRTRNSDIVVPSSKQLCTEILENLDHLSASIGKMSEMPTISVLFGETAKEMISSVRKIQSLIYTAETVLSGQDYGILKKECTKLAGYCNKKFEELDLNQPEKNKGFILDFDMLTYAIVRIVEVIRKFI